MTAKNGRHEQQDSLGDGLQLADLLVEVRQVLLDDVRQLLDLHGLVVENSLPPENLTVRNDENKV